MSKNLTSGSPFWPIKDGLPDSYLELKEDLGVDVIIVGAGISGALIGHKFASEGAKVAIIDKRRIAHGSTAASTALLQYELDVRLWELKNKIGKEEAERAYFLCAEAIGKIGKIASLYPERSFFEKKPSMYLAAKEKDLVSLKKEFEARQEAGFEVSWIKEKDLKSDYGIRACGAIRSELGGQIDPYKLVYHILDELKQRGHCIFERTEIDIKSLKTERGIMARTTLGYKINAKKIIFAAGYEAQDFIKEKIVSLKSSYAVVTEKISDKDMWKDRALIWDTGDPYFYARTTEDNRIMIGGRDIVTKNMYIRDLLLKRRAKKLLKDFKNYMPIKDLKIAYQWTGTFGETKDGLPYIGEIEAWKNCYFALGFGGNGTPYGILAADLLYELYQGKIQKIWKYLDSEEVSEIKASQFFRGGLHFKHLHPIGLINSSKYSSP